MATLGYNIALKVNGKTIAGRTQDELNITPLIKESITKDDMGNKNRKIAGKDITFSCQGLVEVSASGVTKLKRDDVVELALGTAPVPFVYDCDGGKRLSGNAVVTGYSESSNSEDEATWSLNLSVSGDVTFQTGE